VKPTCDWLSESVCGPLLDQVEHSMQPYRHHCRLVRRTIVSAGRALEHVINRCLGAV
jgi:hypothetical protein